VDITAEEPFAKTMDEMVHMMDEIENIPEKRELP
jgi:hypothetical protein